MFKNLGHLKRLNDIVDDDDLNVDGVAAPLLLDAKIKINCLYKKKCFRKIGLYTPTSFLTLFF